MEKLSAAFRYASLDSDPFHAIGRMFWFKSGDDEIAGTIASVATGDLGLPMVEVSNKIFAGWNIRHILVGANGHATLFTNRSVPEERHEQRPDKIEGRFFLAPAESKTSESKPRKLGRKGLTLAATSSGQTRNS
jgi:hypothetical protein